VAATALTVSDVAAHGRACREPSSGRVKVARHYDGQRAETIEPGE